MGALTAPRPDRASPSLQGSTVRSADGTTIVVGGALRCGQDYLPFGSALAPSCTAYVVERRGRGGSGPQGPAYSIAKEVEDRLAVQRATGAVSVFGHSYGGLVALEAARQTTRFATVVAYEAGISIGGSIQTGWMPRYRELLAAGDARGAFPAMVREGGHGPLARLPAWYVRMILRVVIRRRRWQAMEPLLAANLAEHEQVARLDDGTAERYRTVAARVLLLGGRKSPPWATTQLFGALERAIPACTAEVIDGLDHFAPDEKAPERVAARVRAFCSSADGGERPALGSP